MSEQYCVSHENLMIEIEKVEKSVFELSRKEDTRHETFLMEMGHYQADREVKDTMIKAIHKRMDKFVDNHEDLSLALKGHMMDEMAHHQEVAKHMATTNEILKNVATKEEIAVIKGDLKSVWTIGTAVVGLVLVVVGFFAIYIKDDLTDKINTSSKINYYGTKKVIEKIIRK